MTVEMKQLISLVSDKTIWIYIGIFFVLMYLLISLLTWSFKKPLKYLGIPTIGVGVVFIIIRFLSVVIVGLVDDKMAFVRLLLPSMLSPMLLNGILCTVIGIAMIVVYKLLNKKDKKEEITTA